MAENILTPFFRAGFISVFKPSKPQNGKQDPKYSVRACFPPNADLTALKREAQAAAADKWGSNMPKSLRSPFRKNLELDAPVQGIDDDWIIMTFSAPADKRPGLVNARNEDIIDEVEVYSGAWFRAQVRAYAYDNDGNKGVAFGLQNIQKVKDDDPIGQGRMPANKAFEPVTAPASDDQGGLGSLFD